MSEHFDGTAYYFDGTMFGGYRHYETPVWHCKYCDARNVKDLEKCWYCGAPRKSR
jgi:hypothetical protein